MPREGVKELMADESSLAEERLVNLLHRLRKLGLGQCPCQDGRVTMPQLALLDWIAGSPGSGIQEIAAGLELTAPTVSVGVRRLQEAGLLERRVNPQNGRAIQLFLTAEAQALCRRARSFRCEKARRLLAGLTPQEQGTLLDLLERAIAAVEADLSRELEGTDL